MTAIAAPDGLPLRPRIFALVATSIGSFTSTLDTSIAVLVLPTIARAFGVPAELSVWVVTAYQLAVTASILLFAALGEALGVRRVFLWSLVAFTVASAGCALAPSFAMLVAMRAVQGLAASAGMVLTAPINRTLYPRAMLGRALAVNALFVAGGSAAGPAIGGLILAIAPWQTLFWINIPLVALAIVCGIRFLPPVAPVRRPIDLPSAIMVAIGFSALVYGLDGFARHAAPAAIAALAGGGAVIVGIFLLRQARLATPLLAIGLFRRPLFALSALASIFTYTSYSAALVTLPFYLQVALGRPILESGLLLVAWPVGTFAVARTIGPLSDRYPAALLGTIGMLAMAAGLAWLALLPAQPPAIVAATLLAGAGFGFFQTPNNHAMIAAVPVEHTGRATGIVATLRVAGQTLGAATAAIVFGLIGAGGGTMDGEVAFAFWITVALALVAAAISAARAGAR